MHMDRQAKMRDYHVHFTGSLPRKYIFTKLLEYKRKNELPLDMRGIKTYSQFLDKLDNYFSGDYLYNKSRFFEIYKLFQQITKPTNSTEFPTVYSEGCFEICKNFVNNGISNFDIIAGPCSTIDLTYSRLKNMIEGINRAESLFNKTVNARIRLTFIRNSSGIIKNYSISLLNDIFYLLKEPYFSKRIIGFDISGEEKPLKNYFDENCSIIENIEELNRKTGTHFEIGIHAGENIDNSPDDKKYFLLFRKLLSLNITRICHGTFLWLNIDKEKEFLLKSFAEKKVIFDICPTANLLLTPLKSHSQIPISFFKEIALPYTFNRDNPSIFGNLIIP